MKKVEPTLRGPIYDSDKVYVGVDAAGNLHIHIDGVDYLNDEIATRIEESETEDGGGVSHV